MRHSKFIQTVRESFVRKMKKSKTGYALLLTFTIVVSAMAGCSVSAKSYIADASPSKTVHEQMLLGDADRNGIVDLTDVQLILRRYLGMINEEGVSDEVCDVNRDRIVDLTDAQVTLQYILDIIEEFPVIYPEENNRLTESDSPIKSESPIESKRPSEIPVASNNPVETEDTTTEKKQMKTIQLKINDKIVPVQWENNESADALLQMLEDAPLTINMSMYGGFEQVGSLGTELVKNDKQTTTKTGDIVLYSGNSIVMFYGSNSWAYTRLGKIEAPESEIIQLLSNGNVTVTLTAVMEN